MISARLTYDGGHFSINRYAERTKGAEKLVPVVLEPSARSSRDWRGGIGMVPGSRPYASRSRLTYDLGEFYL